MDNFNKVSLRGRLGSDPEAHTFESGDKVVRFSLATTEIYIDRSGSPNKKTDWHRISVFEQTAAENCTRLRQGDLVEINGKLETRSWEKDGQKHWATDVCVRPNPEHSVKFVQRPASKQQNG